MEVYDISLPEDRWKETPTVSSDYLQVGFVILVEKHKMCACVWVSLWKRPLLEVLLAFRNNLTLVMVANKMYFGVCYLVQIQLSIT